ncbi:hypothetical protein ACIQMR_12000 [Streptomyces sp. NPDC091376]|uniref:hypothetical protein n=1 Tax=Streptomyces sp. NPDC091376 TaxID=3365994 RepID=UPI00382CEFFE
MRSALLALAARSQDPSRDIPQPTPSAPVALEEKIELLLGVLAWVGTTAGVVGVLVTGIMMAVSHRRGELSEHMSRLATVLVGCGLVSVAGPLVTFVFG